MVQPVQTPLVINICYSVKFSSFFYKTAFILYQTPSPRLNVVCIRCTDRDLRLNIESGEGGRVVGQQIAEKVDKVLLGQKRAETENCNTINVDGCLKIPLLEKRAKSMYFRTFWHQDKQLN